MARLKALRAGLVASTLVGVVATVGATGVASASTTNAVTSIAPGNPIPAENKHAGSDLLNLPWAGYTVSDDMKGGEMKGFATQQTVVPGSSISFKTTVNKSQKITISILRLGYYQGHGARLMTTLSNVSAVHQPSCTNNKTSGELSCSNWSTTATLKVPTNWVSGVYEAVFSSNTSKYQSVAPFWVADYSRKSDVLMVSAVNTYEAYNNYPWDTLDPNAVTPPTGKSLYDFNSSNGVPAYQVTFDRPYSGEYGGDGLGGFGDFEPELIYFLEKNGYDVSYSNDVSIDADPTRLLHHRSIVIGGHSEYWSKAGYDGIETARSKGVGFAFMSSNEIFWQIRYANNRRDIICHKGYTVDPETDPALKTVNWRSYAGNTSGFNNFNTAGPNRPEQKFLGVQLPMYAWKNWGGSPFVVQGATSTNGKWVYAGTGLTNGAKISSEVKGTYSHLVGYEMDAYDSSVGKPAGSGYTILGASPFTSANPNPNNPNGPLLKFTSNSSIYKSTGGNYVWASGTMGWSWGLAPGGVWGETDPNPEGPDPADNVAPATQIITRNVLNKEISTAPAPK